MEEVDKSWTITFSEAVDEATLKDNIHIVNTELHTVVPLKGNLHVTNDGHSVTITPDGIYQYGTYEVRVTTGVTSKNQQPLAAPYTHVFQADKMCTHYDALKNTPSSTTSVVYVNEVVELGVCKGKTAIDRSYSSTMAKVSFPYVGESNLYYFMNVDGRVMMIRKEDADMLQQPRLTYTVSDGMLYKGKTALYTAPSFLQEGETYISDDGQCFFHANCHFIG